MTERFERIYGDVDIFCIDHENNEYIDKEDYDKIVNKLNALHQSITKLQEDNTELRDAMKRMMADMMGGGLFE